MSINDYYMIRAQAAKAMRKVEAESVRRRCWLGGSLNHYYRRAA